MKYMLFRFVNSPWTGPIRRSGLIISHIDMIESSWVAPVTFGKVWPSFWVTGPEDLVFPSQFTLPCCSVREVYRRKRRDDTRPLPEPGFGISGIKPPFPCRIRNGLALRIIHVSDFPFAVASDSLLRLHHSTASASYSLCAIQLDSLIGDRSVCCKQRNILCRHWNSPSMQDLWRLDATKKTRIINK